MDKLKKVRTEFVKTFGATQPVEMKRQFADFVIGGLLVVLAIGGLAM